MTEAMTGLTRIDRFVLPAGEPRIASFLFERLLAPHNLRERLRRAAVLSVPGRAAAGQPARVEGDVVEAIAAAGFADARWLLVEDYSGNERDRLAVFLFESGEATPAAVLKLRRAGAAGRPLRQEADALSFLAGRLPAGLRDSVPRLLDLRELPGWEVLAMSPLPGVSAYVEMQGRLAPGRAVARHFAAAAEWLARFHEATGAAHGDFWARNLLVGPQGRAAVVDWEHFAPAAPFHEDLFHFPLTYALNYPWRRWRRLPPEEAFRRAFREDNRVSRAVTGYFARYAALAGADPADLRRRFDAHLESRQEDGRCVFSG